MNITISLSSGDLERIRNALGISGYNDIHTAIVEAFDNKLAAEEEKKQHSEHSGNILRQTVTCLRCRFCDPWRDIKCSKGRTPDLETHAVVEECPYFRTF